MSIFRFEGEFTLPPGCRAYRDTPQLTQSRKPSGARKIRFDKGICGTSYHFESKQQEAYYNRTINLSKAKTAKMDSLRNYFQELYKNFNDRNIELVISHLTDDVKWANGMEGGYVYGHDGVREYWARQFTMVSSKVIPLEIHAENGFVEIKVHQVVHDLDGNLLADKTVYHFFQLRHNKIAEFEIGEKTKD